MGKKTKEHLISNETMKHEEGVCVCVCVWVVVVGVGKQGMVKIPSNTLCNGIIISNQNFVPSWQVLHDCGNSMDGCTLNCIVRMSYVDDVAPHAHRSERR